MLHKLTVRAVAILTLALLPIGCSKAKGPPRLKTTPVSGIIHVDDQPAVAVTIECHPQSPESPIKYPVMTMTDGTGKFALGMYQAGDGLPEGKYVLVFRWEEVGLAPKDRLKGAYSNPAKSKHEFTVGDKPQDLGTIQLSTKNPA